MTTKTINRRLRRNKQTARHKGMDAAAQNIPTSSNPYVLGGNMSNYWLAGYAEKLAEIFNNENAT